MPLKSRDPRPEVPKLPFQLAILSICAVPEFHYDAFDNSVVGQKLKQRVDDRLIQWFTTYPYALAPVFAFQMALGANVIAVFTTFSCSGQPPLRARRTEEHGVGKDCVRTYRSRGPPATKK